MKLLYRGTSYDYNPHLSNERISWSIEPVVKPTYSLTYRGQAYLVNPNLENQPAATPSSAQLIYRGAAYQLNGETASDAKVAIHNQRVAKHSAAIELAKVHRTNLQRNLQHRLQVAQERGDQTLVQLLEREMQQIA